MSYCVAVSFCRYDTCHIYFAAYLISHFLVIALLASIERPMVMMMKHAVFQSSGIVWGKIVL